MTEQHPITPPPEEQITLDEALRLVDFDQYHDGSWFVRTVKSFCDTVEGSCCTVKGNCTIIKGHCGTVEGDCHTVEGRVLYTINGRPWQYVETPREKMVRLIEEGASKEQLLKALKELDD